MAKRSEVAVALFKKKLNKKSNLLYAVYYGKKLDSKKITIEFIAVHVMRSDEKTCTQKKISCFFFCFEHFI